MKKFTVLFLAALFMVAGTAYLISMTGADKAERQAMRDNVLSFKKAMLGSSGLEVMSPERVDRARGEGRVRIINVMEQAADEDEGGDVGGCPACVETVLAGTVAGGDTDVYCLACCLGQIVKLDVNSEKLGASTDVAVLVTDAAGAAIAGDDDGRGLSGTSTDACVMFACPADGLYNVEISNLSNAGVSEAASGYELTAEVLCPEAVATLNCPIGAGGDEDPDEAADEGGDPVDPGCGFAGGSGRTQGWLSTRDFEPGKRCFSACLGVGDVLTVSVDSGECDNTLGRPQIDPVLTLEDELGNVVASDDDTDDLDPGLVYHAQDCGQYRLCISDASFVVGGLFDLSWSIVAGGETDTINCAGGAGGDEDEDPDVPPDL